MTTHALQRIRSGFFARYPEGHEDEGDLITRTTACECGDEHRQFVLSERFLTSVERHSARAIDLLTKQIPGLWVPVFCPRCERRDLGRQAQIDQARHSYTAHDHHHRHDYREAAAR